MNQADRALLHFSAMAYKWPKSHPKSGASANSTTFAHCHYYKSRGPYQFAPACHKSGRRAPLLLFDAPRTRKPSALEPCGFRHSKLEGSTAQGVTSGRNSDSVRAVPTPNLRSNGQKWDEKKAPVKDGCSQSGFGGSAEFSNSEQKSVSHFHRTIRS